VIVQEQHMETQQFSTTVNRFVVDQNRRKLSRIELMIRELSLAVAKLDKEIAAEEAKIGINDPKHFAYSCYAKAAAQRRDNLLRTIDDLKQSYF
jgi:flagellar FliJ protein